MVKKQIARLIDFVSECERRASGLTVEDQASGTGEGSELPEIKLNDEQVGKTKREIGV